MFSSKNIHTDYHSDIFTVGIGGAAGDGVREAGQSLGQILAELGYEVFISNTYPSLIRGGHNFTRVSFAKEKIWCDHEKLDVLIALNEETVKLHTGELHSAQSTQTAGGDQPAAVIFADSFDDEDTKTFGVRDGANGNTSATSNAVALPMSSSAKELGASPITRNSVAMGAICYLLDLDYSIMQKILADVFKNKQPEANIKLADIGYEFMKKLNFRHDKKLEPSAQKKELIDGNTAFGKGLMVAGLDFYVGYPMTPSSGILHFLAGQAGAASATSVASGGDGKATSLKVIQPESELAVVNMALGMSYAGKRVAVGSATGGFMLMQEAFSNAGMAELPLVVAVAQRQAPATGVPTYSSQTDLQLVIHSGHGEFPRIVMAPGDAEEAYRAGADALNLAWKYQLPVIVLMDKILCEHSATSLLDTGKITIDRGLTTEKIDEKYARYAITENGISPMAFPGTPNAVVKVTSYEHDQSGITTEEADEVKAMIDKRFKKGETLRGELVGQGQETVKVYYCGEDGIYGSDEKAIKKVTQIARTTIVFWGSTKGPVLEAAKYLKKPVKLVQIVWMEPFDSVRVAAELEKAKKIINIECNHNAQMAALIREKTGIVITENILKYDSRPFDPIKLAEEINAKL